MITRWAVAVAPFLGFCLLFEVAPLALMLARSVVADAGGLTLAESEDSAVVYGMPQAAVASGAVDEVLSLAALARRIESLETRH